MKIFPFLLSLWITSAFAQDDTSWEVNHYEQTRTFVKDGYTYQCDVEKGVWVYLYNKDRKLYGQKQIDVKTGKGYTYNFEGQHIKEDNWTKPKAYSIVNQAFSPELRSQLRGKKLLIELQELVLMIIKDLIELVMPFQVVVVMQRFVLKKFKRRKD